VPLRRRRRRRHQGVARVPRAGAPHGRTRSRRTHASTWLAPRLGTQTNTTCTGEFVKKWVSKYRR
jgi:hypothetical protein